MHVSRSEIVDYLINHAGFTTKFTKGKSTDYLFGIYMDKKNTAARYLQDVLNFYKNHPEITKKPPIEELNKMNFIEIRNLRTALGIPELLQKEKKYKKHLSEVISYFREHPEIPNHPTEEEIFALSAIDLEKLRKKFKITANTQRVIDIEPAYEAAQKARETIKQTGTSKLAANIIIGSEEADVPEKDDYQFITLPEAIEMYGDDISDEFLERQGYKLYEPLNYDNSAEMERKRLIEFILATNITINNQPINFNTLSKLDLEDLQYLYYVSNKLTDNLENEGPKKTL